MKNPILASVALGALLLTEGTINQAAAIFVRTPPPRPVSVGVVGRRPGRRYVWTGGYYRWGRGRRGRSGFLGAGEVAASAARRNDMGFTEVAAGPRGIHIRGGPLAPMR